MQTLRVDSTGSLPRRDAKAPATAVSAAAVPARAPTADELAAARVLVVAEHPGVREMIRLLLRDNGMRQVRDAANGEAGVGAAMNWLPDLIICDIEMDEMNGLDMMARLQEEGLTGRDHIPTILLAADTDREKVLRAKDLGADGFLVKPITAKHLHSRVNFALSRTD